MPCKDCMLLDEERGVYLALMFSSIEKDRSGAMEGHQWMYACMLGGASSCSVCILFILLVKDD